MKNYWVKNWVMRRPTNIELATNKLKWRVRWRHVESFFAHFRYGLWGWKRWWKETFNPDPPRPTYGSIGPVLASLNCSRCGVFLYWKSNPPTGDFACPICGNVQNLHATKVQSGYGPCTIHEDWRGMYIDRTDITGIEISYDKESDRKAGS